jgi:hypothetical protein
MLDDVADPNTGWSQLMEKVLFGLSLALAKPPLTLLSIPFMLLLLKLPLPEPVVPVRALVDPVPAALVAATVVPVLALELVLVLVPIVEGLPPVL